MGHACQILTFSTSNKKEIEAECNEWADRNCDPLEGGHGGLPNHIDYTNKVFNSFKEAREYLFETFGNYDEKAVRYKVYPDIAPTKAMTELKARIGEWDRKYRELSDNVHYQGVSSKTISCKKCQASLPTSYCGHTYKNYCPVCNSDLRPASTLERIETYRKNRDDLQKRYDEEERKQQTKLENMAKLYWAVACEVHS